MYDMIFKRGRSNLKSKSKVLVRIILLFAIIPFLIIGCGKKAETSDTKKKVLILGFDGMDPIILRKMMDEGRMPNFKKLAEEGSFKELQTSNPPQSPVAWSNFITGMNPGGHGIFDFVHRDPKTLFPYLSTSRTEAGKKSITIGDWVIPLESGKVELLRHGKSFWEILQSKGVPCTVYMIPSNFPPVECEAKTLSGMGTPDMLGTYGTFSYYSNVEPEMENGEISGGKYYEVYVKRNTVKAKIYGPKNTFRKGAPDCTVDFTVYIDPENPVAKIVLPNKEIFLKEGEWSEWIRIDFELIPYLQSVSGICRFYLKEVHPDFKLYVTPININPEDPALPISTPPDFSKELFENVGYFYTQGMPEDTKALSSGIFDDGEFIKQITLVHEEEVRNYHYLLSQFKSGLLFYYFSSTDQNAHMFWRLHDKNHPAFNQESYDKYGDVLEKVYEEMDDILGYTLKRIDDNTTLIIMSDHGFAPFYYSFNINTWLLNNGYVALIDPSKQGEEELFANVDWSRTKAYVLGLNALYINLAGREANGIVSPGDEYNQLVDELVEKLKKVVDPKTGKKVFRNVYKRDDIYSGPYVKDAPDILLGFARGYRISWEASLGKFPKELITDNMEAWSGDHCMAPEEVPGIILSNKKIVKENPALYDIAPTLLAEFGFEKEKEMVGSNIF
ncbi:MAG: hypothetical protein D6734_08200 [Candidatus Schekmanbacteria bacterium]|nr:MAG: hypothetical protein D6734_08200 [Candidatus Schekmanbacteria bacterium]